MWKIIAALFYNFITISNAMDSDSPSIENEALHPVVPEFLGKEELQYIVSLGVFKDGNYTHICVAVMITGLNGITAAKCGRYEYYAEEAELIECEEDLAKENRSKLHVNTKRPIHFEPDTIYTVIDFIDFNEYLFDKTEGKDLHEQYDIGVFVLKNKVQYTRPLLNVPISTIKKLPTYTPLTVIGMNSIVKRPSGEETFMKKNIMRMIACIYRDITSLLKPSQIHVVSDWYPDYTSLTMKDLGAPVYLGNQYVGILVEDTYAILAIDADLEKHIDKIIASTWIPWINGRQTKGSAKTSTRNATASRISI